VVGPKPTSHVVCPDWLTEVMLFHSAGRLTCHAAGEFTIDGRPYTDCGPLSANSLVAGEGFSFSLEQI
jgi:hypothetical protein